jgi:spore germination protein GerM
MKNSSGRLVLLAVSLVLLAGCAGRTVLHGTKSHKQPTRVGRTRVAVWFVKGTSDGDPKLVAVTRPTNGADRLEAAVEELLEGPSAHEEHDGLGTEIPRGTILLDVKRGGGSIQLNLSRRFASGGGTTSFETRLAQLRRTVAMAADAPVYLNVEGKRLDISEGEGIEIHQPINR